MKPTVNFRQTLLTLVFCRFGALFLSVLLSFQATAKDVDFGKTSPSLLKLQIVLRGKGEDYELKIDNVDTAYYNNPNRHGPRIDTALNATRERIEKSQILVIVHARAGVEEEIFKRIAHMRSFLKPRILFADMGHYNGTEKNKVVLWKSENGKRNLFVVGGVEYRRAQDVVHSLRSNKVRFVVAVGFGPTKANTEPPAELREELKKSRIDLLKTTYRLRVWDGREE